MKKHIYHFLIVLIASLCLSITAVGQNNNPIECQLTTSCYSIGYVAAFPTLNSNPATTTIELQMVLLPPPTGATCETITQIKFTPTLGEGGTFEGDELPEVGSATPVSFVITVNSNSFKDNTLHVMVSGSNGPIDNFTLMFTEDCGFINPLPVELTSFTGKATQSGIDLNWETASELNNSHFDVEKSSDGRSYRSIARVKGQGSTSAFTKYKFTDVTPQDGINYYRLKQTDYDNTTAYSKTITVKWQAGEAIQVALAPNPCRNGDCNLTVANTQGQETRIELKDMAGRVVYSSTIKSNRYLLELPMSDLTHLKGLYFLTATSGNQVVNQRVVLE